MNSAETYVDILNVPDHDDKRAATFLSESGLMEFFIIGSSLKNGGPKRVMNKLATITGFAPLPPMWSLGYHYSKWEPISTERLNDLMDDFEQNEFPYDVLWLDIEYTKSKDYFRFDEDRFVGFDQLVERMA